MELNERQAERIARWLDGREVGLSAEEQALAERIRRDEVALGVLLDVELPPRARAKAARAIRRELTHRRRRVLRVVIDVAAVAAAAVLVVALLLGDRPASKQPEVPTAVLFADPYSGSDYAEMETLAEEMNEVEARLVATLPPVPREGLAAEANGEAEVFDDPWLEQLLQDLSG